MKNSFTNVIINGKTADMYIYGPIGYSWWDENSWDAAAFVKEFNKVSASCDRINIHINSPGGIIDEGLPIYNIINSCEKDTHTYIDGIAYSMGAIIALAGKTVHAAKNSLMLFHNASGWAMGNSLDFRETADMLDRYDSSLITSLSSKTGLTELEIRNKYFDFKDHLLTATEAKEAGFVDLIDGADAKTPDNSSVMTSDQLFAFFLKQDHSDPLLSKLKDFFKNSFTSFTNKPPAEMENLTLIATALGLAIDSAADVIVSAITALNQKVIDLTASSQASANALAALNASIDSIDVSIAAAASSDAKVIAMNAFITGLKNVDATDKTVAGKTKDDIEATAPNVADSYAHNKTADRILS
ncbi:MAG: Clp protease ClpP [Bacteroidales bacterium]|nr:Clp protease ClpP [Bacteroidales bacterium]